MPPTRSASLLTRRWRDIFCDCGDDGHDPMCLGYAVLKDVLRDWGILGLQHMLRRVAAIEARHEARERALRERIALLESQLELMRPRGFLED